MRQVGLCHPLGRQLGERLFALVRVEGRGTAQVPALRLGAGAALAGAGAYQISLELGEPSKNGQHQAAVRRGGVGPSVGERAESGSAFGDGVESVEQVAGRAGQSVKAGDDKHVSRVEGCKDPGKLPAIGLGPAGSLLKYLLGPRGPQSFALSVEGLPVCADARIAESGHARDSAERRIFLQVSFAIFYASDFNPLEIVQKS